MRQAEVPDDPVTDGALSRAWGPDDEGASLPSVGEAPALHLLGWGVLHYQ